MALQGPRKYRVALVFLALLIPASLSPLLAKPAALLGDDPARSHDYLQQATYDHLFRRAILKEGEFPLRTYFLGGGYPLPANPQDVTFSPFVLTTLVLGEAVGMKINILLFFLIGAIGVFALARHGFGASPPGALYAALAYALSGWWLSRLEWGFYFKFYFHLVPWIWLFLDRARRGRRGVVAAALLLALSTTQLGLGYVVIALFFVLLFSLETLAAPDPEWRRGGGSALMLLAAAFGLCLLFAAAKLLPMAELLIQSPRSVDYDVYRGVAGGYPHFYQSGKVFLRALFFPSPVPNESIAPGLLTLPLALAGLVGNWKRLWPLFVVSIAFVLISFGPYLPLDLFRPLWRLPFFHSMHAPYQLFTFFVLMAACLFAAKGLDRIADRCGKTSRAVVMTFVFGALIAGYFMFNLGVLSKIFTREAPEPEAVPGFYAIRGEDMARGAPRTEHTQQYFNLLRGVGTLDWDGDVLLPEHPQPRFFIDRENRRRKNPRYRGEVYFAEGPVLSEAEGPGSVESFRLTSNRIRVKGRAEGEALLVINQNYDPNFRCDFPIVARDGLLAVKLPPGSFELTLRYRPTLAIIGIVVSLVSLALAGASELHRRRRQKKA